LLRTLLVLCLLAPLASAVALPPARMHATLLSSEPAAKATLATSPSRIRLVFSEEIEPSLGRIRLVAPGGRIIKLASAGDPHDVAALVAPVTSPLEPGRYRVEWRIVSEDGHPIDGAYFFSVSAPMDSARRSRRRPRHNHPSRSPRYPTPPPLARRSPKCPSCPRHCVAWRSAR
jgi:methionine-rich copper-binding protein CopC